jgi:nucleoside phosphorylase
MSSKIDRPRVYISYSWRHHKTKKKALWLADKLRENGIDSRIDLYYGKSLHGFTPPEPSPQPDREDWDYWQEEQIKTADRVIILCTREYASSGPESGVARDVRYINAEVERVADGKRKVIPVGVGSYEENQPFIPGFLKGATYYDIGTRQKGVFGLDDLIRRLQTEFPSALERALPTNSSRTKPKGARAMTKSSLQASDLRGRIHAAIMTIREDEYEAMETQLGQVQHIPGKNNYKYAEITPDGGNPISVVLTRVVGQGNSRAQSVASNIINELDPAWLILVGIAGGVPDSEYSLGDVVLATYLHDFSLTAVTDSGVTYQVGGGNMHREVERFLSTQAVGADGRKLSDLAGFNSNPDLTNHPVVYPSRIAEAKRYYGSPAFRNSVKETIEARFPNGKRNGGPVIRQGPLANGNVLVKSTELLKRWQQNARQIVQIEMELAGVYEAARTAGRENYPVLSIRGLSDIVGFKRDPNWTGYACKTAAAFAAAVLRSGFIDFEKNLPQNPQ